MDVGELLSYQVDILIRTPTLGNSNVANRIPVTGLYEIASTAVTDVGRQSLVQSLFTVC